MHARHPLGARPAGLGNARRRALRQALDHLHGTPLAARDFVYTLRLASGREVLALVPSHHDHAVGERIGIRLDADHVVTFPTDESAATARL